MQTLCSHVIFDFLNIIFRFCYEYFDQKQLIFFSKTVRAAKILDFFLIFLKEFSLKFTNSFLEAFEIELDAKEKKIFDHALEFVTVRTFKFHEFIRRQFNVFLERKFKHFVKIINFIFCKIVIEFRIELNCVIVCIYSRYK